MKAAATDRRGSSEPGPHRAPVCKPGARAERDQGLPATLQRGYRSRANGGNRFSVEGADGRHELKLARIHPLQLLRGGSCRRWSGLCRIRHHGGRLEYDDYNGVAVAGKIVVILRGEPALESIRR